MDGNGGAETKTPIASPDLCLWRGRHDAVALSAAAAAAAGYAGATARWPTHPGHASKGASPSRAKGAGTARLSAQRQTPRVWRRA